MKHLNEKIMSDVENRIWAVEGALMGLGGLFEQSCNKDFCFDPQELFGIGQLLKSLSIEVTRINDILRCGYDSLAQKDIYSIKDDSDDEEPQDRKEVDIDGLVNKNIESILETLKSTLRETIKRK